MNGEHYNRIFFNFKNRELRLSRLEAERCGWAGIGAKRRFQGHSFLERSGTGEYKSFQN